MKHGVCNLDFMSFKGAHNNMRLIMVSTKKAAIVEKIRLRVSLYE